MAFPCPPPSSPLPPYYPFNEFAPPSYPPFDAGNPLSVEDYLPYVQPLDQFAPPSYPPLDGGDAGHSLIEECHFLGYGGVDAGNFLGSLDGGGYAENRTTSLLPGFKFRPTDEELVVHYLQPEFLDASSAPKGFITHADIYDYEPHQLSGLVEQDHGDGKMYFYTRIKKIGKSKTDRSIKSKKGNWKPTQAPKTIRGTSGNSIGYKTSLAYFEGKKKTQWLMQEYRLQSHTSHHSSQELVLAVVYFFPRKSRGDDDDNDY